MKMTVHEDLIGYVDVLTPSGKVAGRLAFLKTDASLLFRSRRAADKYRDMHGKLHSCNINPDGTGKDPESETILADAAAEFESMIEYVLGLDGAAADAFSTYRPFAIMKGSRFWCSCVLDVLTRQIVETVAANVCAAIRK